MDFQKDAYLLAFQRQQQLDELAAKRRRQPANDGKPNLFLTTVKNGLQSAKQLPRLRVQVSFYIKESPKNAPANA